MHIYAGEIYTRSRQPYRWHRRCWLMSWVYAFRSRWRSRCRGGPALPPSPMSLCNYIWHLYAIVSDLEFDRVSIKDESRSDRCSPVGTKSVAKDRFKCNQGRPRCNKSDTIATTTTTSATTKFRGNTYMILHREARKEAIAPHVLQQRTKKFATQIRRCYIAIQK